MTTSRPVVVVIEDEAPIRQVVRTGLSSHGYEVHEADSGKLGLIEAATRKPDVVVLDLGLPDMDGVAVVKGASHPELARQFVEFVGSPAMVTLAAREFFRLPARSDIPADSLPPALRRARAAIRPEPIDWDLLQKNGPEWMRYWDEHVRGGR